MVIGSAKATPKAEIHAANAKSKTLKSMMASSYSLAVAYAERLQPKLSERDASLYPVSARNWAAFVTIKRR
jgi:hypothetical protein